ncbi:MAG: MFS transporter [Lachnospiraceae bacterium]
MVTGKRVLFFGALAIFFTGFPHIWSIYQPYAMAVAGWSQMQASLCFYIYFVTFVLGNIVGGRIQDQYSPRIAIIIGGGIFTASILLSALTLIPSPLAIYGTYGVMQGFGQGMIYTTIISTAQKYYLERTGFASGVIVTANALFGFFMAPVSRNLLERYGIRLTFVIIGILIGISWLLAIGFIKNPPAEATSETTYAGRQYQAGEMIRTRKFWLLLLVMLFGLVPYMLVSPFSQTIQMDRGLAVSVAVTSVMIGSVCNAAARLLLPSMADRLGRIVCIKVVLGISIVTMLALAAAPAVFTPVAVVLVYICYGGIMGSFPSVTSHIFGLKHAGENYGIVMFGLAIATLVSPVIVQVMTSQGLPVEAIFITGAGCATAGFVCIQLLAKEITISNG